MAYSTFCHVAVTGISAVVPKDEIRLEDELRYFGGDIKKARRVTKMVGIDCRRIAPEGITASDLCAQAAENLFAGMAIAKDSVDVLIFISQGPDYRMPATACILQHRLGLPQSCAAFDVNQGCTAYTYGLWLASSLLESGACRKALLLVGESSARLMDPDNRIVTPVFGDCGTATLLEYSAERQLSWYALGTDGSGFHNLIVPMGGARLPFSGTTDDFERSMRPIKDQSGMPWRLASVYMDGLAIFNFTLDTVPDHLRALMHYAGKKQEDIDWLILHQANRQIAENLAERSGFPAGKAPVATFSKYGNQSGASLPGVVCDALQEKVSNGVVPVLLSGYGVGLSWASAIVCLNRIWCSGIREFVMPRTVPAREELLQYWEKRFSGEKTECEVYED